MLFLRDFKEPKMQNEMHPSPPSNWKVKSRDHGEGSRLINRPKFSLSGSVCAPADEKRKGGGLCGGSATLCASQGENVLCAHRSLVAVLRNQPSF